MYLCVHLWSSTHSQGCMADSNIHHLHIQIKVCFFPVRFLFRSFILFSIFQAPNHVFYMTMTTFKSLRISQLHDVNIEWQPRKDMCCFCATFHSTSLLFCHCLEITHLNILAFHSSNFRFHIRVLQASRARNGMENDSTLGTQEHGSLWAGWCTVAMLSESHQLPQWGHESNFHGSRLLLLCGKYLCVNSRICLSRQEHGTFWAGWSARYY